MPKKASFDIATQKNIPSLDQCGENLKESKFEGAVMNLPTMNDHKRTKVNGGLIQNSLDLAHSLYLSLSPSASQKSLRKRSKHWDRRPRRKSEEDYYGP